MAIENMSEEGELYMSRECWWSMASPCTQSAHGATASPSQQTQSSAGPRRRKERGSAMPPALHLPPNQSPCEYGRHWIKRVSARGVIGFGSIAQAPSSRLPLSSCSPIIRPVEAPLKAHVQHGIQFSPCCHDRGLLYSLHVFSRRLSA